MKGKWFQTFDSERRALRQNSYTGMCLSMGQWFWSPWFRKGLYIFFPFMKVQIASSHKTQYNKTWKANCCVARRRPLWSNCRVITCLPCIRASRPKQKKTILSYFELKSKFKSNRHRNNFVSFFKKGPGGEGGVWKLTKILERGIIFRANSF